MTAPVCTYSSKHSEENFCSWEIKILLFVRLVIWVVGRSRVLTCADLWLYALYTLSWCSSCQAALYWLPPADFAAPVWPRRAGSARYVHVNIPYHVNAQRVCGIYSLHIKWIWEVWHVCFFLQRCWRLFKLRVPSAIVCVCECVCVCVCLCECEFARHNPHSLTER